MVRPLNLEVKPRLALRLLLVPLLIGGALRFWSAAAHYGATYPELSRDESYYETGISALSCGLWAIPPEQTPSSHLAPGLPALVVAVEAPFSRPSPGRVRVVQAALSTLAIALVFFAGQAALSPLAGLLAACWLAFDPAQVALVASLNVHVLYSFALLLLAATGLRWLSRRDARASIQLGFALAFSLLCRVVHFSFPLFLLGAVAFWRGKDAPKPRRAVLTLLAAIVFLSPFALRNGLQFGRWSPFDGKGAYLLLAGTVGRGDQATIAQALDAAESLSPGFRARGLQGEALERELVRLAVAEISRAPLRWLGFCLQRLALFWSGLWPYWTLGLFALAAERRARGLQLAGLLAAALSGYALAGGAPVYRAACVPLLCLLGGAGLAVMLSRTKSSPAPRVSETVLGSRVLDAALACALIVYGAAVAASAREVYRWPVRAQGGPRVPVPACTDGRAAAVLELAALAEPDGTAPRVWLSALDRSVGDEMESSSRGQTMPPAARASLDDYDRFVALRPQDSDGWRGRGVLKGVRGDAAGASADLETALSLSPGDLEAAVSLASLPGAGARARALLKKALAASAFRRGEPVYARAVELAR